jgi:hypothetical protein
MRLLGQDDKSDCFEFSEPDDPRLSFTNHSLHLRPTMEGVIAEKS